MNEVELTAAARAPDAGRVFDRVLVGVDGTAASFEACRQALRLAPPGALLEAVAVVHLADAAKVGPTAPRVADELQREAEEALRVAIGILGDTTLTRFVDGVAAPALLHEAERMRAGVLALGSHGHRRATEILIGGVAGDVLHHARCSVLLARPPVDAAAFPRAIVVGDDGSRPAAAAVDTAAALAERLRVPLRRVTAVERRAVESLVEAAGDGELLVVGSRGLHGLRSLGSVSERVAHRARCSVLVVHATVGT